MANNNYKEMAKSSGIVAFVQLFQMFFSLLRNKIIAILLGSAGFGIWSLLNTFIEMVTSFSVLGLDQGGVREIAKSSESSSSIGKCIFTFRISILICSVFFSLIIFYFSDEISIKLFNNTNYSSGIKFISIVTIFYGIAKGGYAILNGVHALKYLAKSQILSAIIGSLGSISIIFFWGEIAIPYALAIVIFSMAIITSLYVKKLEIKSILPQKNEFLSILKKLLSLGIGFTIAALVASLMTLLSRSYLSNHYDLQAVGIYQASWTISNLYIGIILSAMGVDFMPRLAKISHDDNLMNQQINQQIEFGITLSSIGITFILLFSPLILHILYSNEFIIGTNIIRWQILGVALRIVAFPFSYSIMAKSKPIQYAVIQTVFWVLDYIFLILFSKLWGFNALGVNYFIAYIFYAIMTYFACKHNHKFSFSSKTKKISIISCIFICIFWLFTFIISNKFLLYGIGIGVWIIQFIIVNRFMTKTMGFNIFSLVLRRK